MLEKLRCNSCGKVLLVVEVKEGKIEKYCPRCKGFNIWEFNRDISVKNGTILIIIKKTFSRGLAKKK